VWSFTQLGEQGCEVKLRVEFVFSSAVQDALFGSTFERICNELIDAFIRRAHDLYEG
jgi:ribosome-associated toxin RatA of RatAB toxin-antitoxin module